jgi:hypothetical protein
MSDFTLAVSEKTLRDLFGRFIEIFQFETTKSTSGDIRFGIHMRCHLERGAFSLEPPDPLSPNYKGGFFKLTDIVIRWDNLDLSLTVHIPKVTVGGFCVIPNPFGGCLVEAPSVSFFDCDVGPVTIPIGGVVDSRISIGLALLAHRLWNSDENTFQWCVVPRSVEQNIELVNIGDTIGDLINGLIKKLVDAALSLLPDWAKDVVDALLGGIADFIRSLLNLPAELQDWLSTLLRTSLDPIDFILQTLINHFQDDIILYHINDPVEVLAKEETPVQLPAVTMPIKSLDLSVAPQEFIIGVTA